MTSSQGIGTKLEDLNDIGREKKNLNRSFVSDENFFFF